MTQFFEENDVPEPLAKEHLDRLRANQSKKQFDALLMSYWYDSYLDHDVPKADSIAQREKYAAWIRERYPTEQTAYGQCGLATLEMVKDFTELRQVCGFAHCPAPWGARQHWWCVDTWGRIVDPTAHQFPAIFSYEQRKLEEMPTGVCPNCGSDTYMNEDFCSDSCRVSYLAYVNGGPL